LSIRQHILSLFLVLCLPLIAGAQESEEQLREAAEVLFEQEDYEAAFNKYSQLLSLDLQSAEYNFRFGACQLFTIHDKEQALKYLKFAVETPDAPDLSHFYYALGLHLNYRFEKAIKEYEKYQSAAGKKDKELKLAPHYIQQCRSGIDLVSSFTDISVVQREALPRSDFYRNYDLTEFGGKIMVKPEDFMSEEDINRDAKFLMYFQQAADYVYYASYSEKNATGKDLYVIQKLPTGEWSKPKKLSTVINTEYDEDYPFIHPDGNVLYFASKGHNSMGGYDIFKSTRKGDGTWTKPINMEFAINTPWDDFLFISDKAEKTAWFASNRETNSKQVTVYQIGIERVPLDLTLIKGTFETEGSKKAKITIEDVVQNKVIGVYESERQFGEYLLDLRGSGNYKFIVEAEESNAIHTGLVEIPREKGLKQFRQEMKLVNNDGQEQLQIINHFDEPLEDGTLLTADILRKQASLSVNSSADDIIRSTEILDEPSADVETESDQTPEEKIAEVSEKATTLKADADLMNQKASLLFDKAETGAGSSDPEEIAEAAIAVELANEYKTEADKRAAAAAKMNGTIAVLENNALEEAAFKAQLNQTIATASNFEDKDEFESMIQSSYEKRTEPSVAIYNLKKDEKEELESDLDGIDEEITYLKSEVENTKDDALKEEYQSQIAEAEAAKPEKLASIERATSEFKAAETQKINAESYASIANALFTAASAGASAVTATVSAASINEMHTSLSAKAASDPALLAFIAPESAKAAADAALAEARKEDDSNDDDNSSSTDNSGSASSDNTDDNLLGDDDDTGLTSSDPMLGDDDDDDTNNSTSESETAAEEIIGDNDLFSVAESDDENNNESTEASNTSSDLDAEDGGLLDEDEELSSEGGLLDEGNDESSTASDNGLLDEDDDGLTTTNTGGLLDEDENDLTTTDDTGLLDEGGGDLSSTDDNTSLLDEDESSTDINQEIREIEATESKPEIIGEDYADVFQAQIDEAASAEDPVIAETRKAEIYDQWVDNIQYRIDSLSTKEEQASSEEEKLELANQLADLEAEKDVMSALSLNSYSAIASLSDEEAQASATAMATEADAVESANDDILSSDNDSLLDEDTDDDNGLGSEFEGGLLDEDNDDGLGLLDDAGMEDEGISDSDTEEPKNIITEVPPVTLELLASETVPPTVLVLNSTYSQQIQSAPTDVAPIEKLRNKATITQNWADDLKMALDILAAQIETVESEDEKAILQRLSENVAEQRQEKQNKAATIQKQVIALEKEERVAEEKQNLQRQLSEYVESYNGNAFVQIADQVDQIDNEEQRFAQAEILNQNWMVALKNEELKTENRIRNTEDPNQKKELEEKLVKLTAEKLFVQATLDSLDANEGIDGPSAPKSVVIVGSEKYEGYVPVETNKPEQYDQLTQSSYTKITTQKSDLATLETQLAETKKKKLRPAIELEIEEKRNAIEIAEMESEFYEGSEEKIIGVEPLILQLEKGDPTPSQIQMNAAEEISMQAANLTTAAVAKRTDADAIKKKKKRLPAQAEARQSEHMALLKRREADLASNLANEMAVIEAKAIANNFIIPAGSAVELPVVGKALNPTEAADVAKTEQFVSYNTERRKADSIRTLALKLTTLETQLNNQAQNMLIGPAGDDPSMNTPADRVKKTQSAYVVYNKADSLSNEAARLTRQAAVIENDANSALLTNPEEVYNSIVAFYNTDTQPRVVEPTAEEIAALGENTISDINSELGNDATEENDDFALTPPTQANQAVNVPTDVLTNTIFEVDQSATSSFYSSTTPIPVNPPLPSGVIFKVQIGAFRNAIRQDAFKGIKPITGESTGTGLTRYSAGAFDNFAEADFAKDEIRGIGYNDAFVVAYRNGERISVGAARSAIASGETTGSVASNNVRTGATSSGSLPANSVVKQGNLVVNNVAGQSGTFFTVQVGVYSRPVRSSDIYNLTPLNQEDLPNGTYRYSSGIYNNEGTATQAKDEIRALGISDAFVTAYRGGGRVTVDQARQELGSGGGTSAAVNNTSKVFLGTYSGEIPVNQAAIILGLNSKEIDKVSNGDGSSSYFYGGFASPSEAEQEASRLIGLGLDQARAENN